MPIIKLANEHASVVLDSDRGGEFVEFRAGDSDNLLFYGDWKAPLSVDAGPVYGSTELDWLSRYNGGWQVLFPNAGAECVVDGVPLAFHGETSLARTEVQELEADRCQLSTYARLPLELTRTIRLADDRPAILVEETAKNVGSRPVSFLWGHHPTFPAIAGSTIDLAGGVVEVEPATPGPLTVGRSEWPTARGATGERVDLSVIPSAEQVRLLYLHHLSAHWVAMRPPASTRRPGVALAWDGEAFPNLWIWLQNADSGFPWYGRSRMIGLEPQRAWPFDGAAAAIERGHALTVQPGEIISSWITLAAFDGVHDPVRDVSQNGAVR